MINHFALIVGKKWPGNNERVPRTRDVSLEIVVVYTLDDSGNITYTCTCSSSSTFLMLVITLKWFEHCCVIFELYYHINYIFSLHSSSSIMESNKGLFHCSHVSDLRECFRTTCCWFAPENGNTTTITLMVNWLWRRPKEIGPRDHSVKGLQQRGPLSEGSLGQLGKQSWESFHRPARCVTKAVIWFFSASRAMQWRSAEMWTTQAPPRTRVQQLSICSMTTGTFVRRQEKPIWMSITSAEGGGTQAWRLQWKPSWQNKTRKELLTT